MSRSNQIKSQESHEGVDVGTGPENMLVTLAYRSYCLQPPHNSRGPPAVVPMQTFVPAFAPTKLVGIGAGAAVAA
jgi:hypothetical protein